MTTSTILKNIKHIIVFTIFSSLILACNNPASKKKILPQDFAKRLNLAQKQKLGMYSRRGSDDDAPTLMDSLSNAINLSISGKYDDAKKALIKLNAIHPDNEAILLQLAIQDFYTKKYSDCIDKLSKVINSKDIDIRCEAEIIMANASLSIKDDNKTAKKWFDKIADDSSHTFQKDAKDQIVIFLETY